MLERLARTMYRRRKTVLVVWIVAPRRRLRARRRVGGAFKTEFKLPGTESQAAYDLLQKSSFRDRQMQAQIVFEADQGVHDPEVQAAMEDLFAQIEETSRTRRSRARTPTAASARSARTARSPTRSSTSPTGPRKSSRTRARRSRRSARRRRRASTASRSTTAATCSPRRRSTAKSEAIGLLAAIIILLFAFGSVLAMGLPIGTALFGIGTGIAIVMIVRQLRRHARLHHRGDGDDRARRRHRLRAVHRHPLPREPRTPGSTRSAAWCVPLDTAGRAVLFAGTTVMISLLGLLLMRTSIMRGLGDRHRDRRAHHDARVGHAAARAARLRRPQHRQVRAAAPRSAPTGTVHESVWTAGAT